MTDFSLISEFPYSKEDYNIPHKKINGLVFGASLVKQPPIEVESKMNIKGKPISLVINTGTPVKNYIPVPTLSCHSTTSTAIITPESGKSFSGGGKHFDDSSEGTEGDVTPSNAYKRQTSERIKQLSLAYERKSMSTPPSDRNTPTFRVSYESASADLVVKGSKPETKILTDCLSTDTFDLSEVPTPAWGIKRANCMDFPDSSREGSDWECGELSKEDTAEEIYTLSTKSEQFHNPNCDSMESIKYDYRPPGALPRPPSNKKNKVEIEVKVAVVSSKTKESVAVVSPEISEILSKTTSLHEDNTSTVYCNPESDADDKQFDTFPREGAVDLSYSQSPGPSPRSDLMGSHSPVFDGLRDKTVILTRDELIRRGLLPLSSSSLTDEQFGCAQLLKEKKMVKAVSMGNHQLAAVSSCFTSRPSRMLTHDELVERGLLNNSSSTSSGQSRRSVVSGDMKNKHLHKQSSKWMSDDPLDHNLTEELQHLMRDKNSPALSLTDSMPVPRSNLTVISTAESSSLVKRKSTRLEIAIDPVQAPSPSVVSASGSPRHKMTPEQHKAWLARFSGSKDDVMEGVKSPSISPKSSRGGSSKRNGKSRSPMSKAASDKRKRHQLLMRAEHSNESNDCQQPLTEAELACVLNDATLFDIHALVESSHHNTSLTAESFDSYEANMATISNNKAMFSLSSSSKSNKAAPQHRASLPAMSTSSDKIKSKTWFGSIKRVFSPKHYRKSESSVSKSAPTTPANHITAPLSPTWRSLLPTFRNKLAEEPSNDSSSSAPPIRNQSLTATAANRKSPPTHYHEIKVESI